MSSSRALVFLFDGTWFGPYRADPSHVMRMTSLLEPVGAKDHAHTVFYYPGVGTGAGTGKLAKSIDKVFGGAFAAGYRAILSKAYLDLVLNYKPGDRIYLLGWSRGAFVARQLVHLIRCIGLSDKSHISSLPQLINHVISTRARGPGYHPDGRYYLELRKEISGRVVVGAGAEQAYLAQSGLPPKHLFRIEYLGLWDCVSAVGPTHRFVYQDDHLSMMVNRSRHAVSADERRSVFKPDLWSNLDSLNSSTERKSHEQVVFPGDHSVVGGGLSSSFGLSMTNFVWIAEGAVNAGLSVSSEELQKLRREIDFEQPLRAPVSDLNRALSLMARDRNLRGLSLSEAFRERQKLEPTYWPSV